MWGSKQSPNLPSGRVDSTYQNVTSFKNKPSYWVIIYTLCQIQLGIILRKFQVHSKLTIFLCILSYHGLSEDSIQSCMLQPKILSLNMSCEHKGEKNNWEVVEIDNSDWRSQHQNYWNSSFYCAMKL